MTTGADPGERSWLMVSADWLHAGAEYRIRTRDALAGESCAYCGGPAEVCDHVIPRPDGSKPDGDNSPENLVPACRTCNFKKSKRTLDEWIALMERANNSHDIFRLSGARQVRSRMNRPRSTRDRWWLE